MAFSWSILMLSACKKDPQPDPVLECRYRDTIHYVDTQYIDTFVMLDAIYPDKSGYRYSLFDTGNVLYITDLICNPADTFVLPDSSSIRYLGGYRDTVYREPWRPGPVVMADLLPCVDGFIDATLYIRDTTIFIQQEIPYSYGIFEIVFPDQTTIIDTGFYDYKFDQLKYIQSNSANVEEYINNVSIEVDYFVGLDSFYWDKTDELLSYKDLFHQLPVKLNFTDSISFDFYFLDTYPYDKQVDEMPDLIYYIDFYH
ncbi:hypothetical protein [Maribellus sediminis]|uniref:hypothetical protein n=1 Tax=Maribellus sediminis TaxID=2696285 RepID=UPI0014315E19|nr:hypothetical protein [Maribellus sediminis]